MSQTEEIQVGGQAVIEGVMMRSQDLVSVAVRRKDGSIVVKKDRYTSFTKRFKIFSMPILRGAVILFESLYLGIKALTFSSDVVMADEKTTQATERIHSRNTFAKIWLAITVLFSLAVGLLIFFYVPLILTGFLGIEGGFLFNLVDGMIRIIFFLIYLGTITLMKDIRRIFEYHGAEHKSIFTLEKKLQLLPGVAKKMSRFHPRCGTSFLLIVMLVSILVFMFLGKPDTIMERFYRLLFVPLIGGISYELIRWSSKSTQKAFWRYFILPGLWLQKITTKEPDESQLEVAIVALKTALGEDVSQVPGVTLMGDISRSFELEAVQSS